MGCEGGAREVRGRGEGGERAGRGCGRGAGGVRAERVRMWGTNVWTPLPAGDWDQTDDGPLPVCVCVCVWDKALCERRGEGFVSGQGIEKVGVPAVALRGGGGGGD